MKNLKFTRLAENDLLEVFEYIARDNPDAAYAVHAAILETCETLSERPDIAQMVVNSNIKGLRRAVVKRYPSYLIFYRQMNNVIEIIRLGEGHRDWHSIFN